MEKVNWLKKKKSFLRTRCKIAVKNVHFLKRSIATVFPHKDPWVLFLTAILHRGLRNDFFLFFFSPFTFSNFYLDYFFPFLFGLLFPFSSLDFYFPFLFGLFFISFLIRFHFVFISSSFRFHFVFNSITVTHLGFFQVFCLLFIFFTYAFCQCTPSKSFDDKIASKVYEYKLKILKNNNKIAILSRLWN